MFYPFKGTLTYSEILLPQAVAAFPILAVFGNPILSYNIVLLLAFLTSALGMRALARHLVKNEFAAFLANGYYGIFLTLFAGLFIVAWMIGERRYADRKFWARLALFAAFAAAFVDPVLFRYFLMSRGTDFNRGPGSPLPLTSYMSAPSINRLYGQITQPFRKSEGDLFPGIIAVILAGLGLAANLRIRPMSSQDEFRGRLKIPDFARAAVTGLMAADAFWILAEIMSGFELGSSNEVLFHPTCLLRLPIPAGILLLLIALRRTFERRLRGPAYRISFKDKKFWTYPVLLVLAALLTMGSRGLYVFLYKCVPGFSGLRATPRFHIFFMLALAVLAAHGAKALMESARPAKPLQAESRVRRPLEKKGGRSRRALSRIRRRRPWTAPWRRGGKAAPQAVGVSVAVDLKTIETVGGFSFKLGRSPLDYPRGYLAEVSTDGRTWETVARQEKTVLPIRAFLRPKDLGLEVEFAPRGVRYIRITNTAEEPIYSWSIYEIEVYR